MPETSDDPLCRFQTARLGLQGLKPYLVETHKKMVAMKPLGYRVCLYYFPEKSKLTEHSALAQIKLAETNPPTQGIRKVHICPINKNRTCRKKNKNLGEDDIKELTSRLRISEVGLIETGKTVGERKRL